MTSIFVKKFPIGFAYFIAVEGLVLFDYNSNAVVELSSLVTTLISAGPIPFIHAPLNPPHVSKLICKKLRLLFRFLIPRSRWPLL